MDAYLGDGLRTGRRRVEFFDLLFQLLDTFFVALLVFHGLPPRPLQLLADRQVCPHQLLLLEPGVLLPGPGELALRLAELGRQRLDLPAEPVVLGVELLLGG